MKMKKPIEIILFMCLVFLSSMHASEETAILIDKEAYIELVTKKYALQTKGLIPYFDSSELFEQIPNSDLAVVMLPYGTSSNENDFILSLVLAVVDVKQQSIVQSYFHKDIAQSDAIYVSDIILDTKTFHDISKHTTFTVTIQHIGSSRPNPYGSYNLYMYSLKDGKLSLILDTFEVMNSGGENDTVGTGYEISRALTYKSHKTSKAYDTLIFDSLSKRVDFDYSDNKSDENITGVVSKEVRLYYIDGKYENIGLKHLEVEVKEGKVRSKIFYVELLEKMPITKDNVRTYNDMAYYLEQANHTEEAIVILDEVLQKFYERVVAYLNLADAYWKLGEKNDAYVNYMQYKESMCKKKKKSKIPTRVQHRLALHKKDFEKLFLGQWKDKDGDIRITIYTKHTDLHYRVQTSKHTWKGKLKITPDGYIVFSQIRWAEYRGNLASERDYAQVGKPQKVEELPLGVDALFDFDNKEFVIQNAGNAMNYYVKFKESDKKYIYFRRKK